MPSKKTVVKTYLAPEEYQQILDSSTQTGLSLSCFVKRVCLGQPAPNRETQQRQREMLKVNADLGRLGGLFKLWLSITDPPEPELRPEVRRILREIEARQRELKAAILSMAKG
jgi:hypothetical protein